MTSDTDAETRRIPGRGATRVAGGIRRGLAGGVVGSVVGVAVVLLVALLALFGLARLTHWPFGSEERDRSGPAVLTAMRDLSEYHAATGQYQVVIDIQQDAKFLPDIIKGKRTIFLAIGSVDSYVDFRKLGDDAVQSRVLNQDLGLIDRLGNLFSDQPNPQNQQMYQVAEQRLADAARQVGLQKRAEDNTRATLDKLMRSLGFTTVDITFVNPAAGG